MGAISRFALTGVDAENAILLSFPNAIGIASSGIRVDTDPNGKMPAVRISGTKGEIQVAHPAYRPESFVVIRKGEDGVVEENEYRFEIPGGGHGMFWEADAAGRAIRDGELESDIMPLEESLLILRAMDKVRADAGFRYPEAIETTKH